MNRDLEKLFDLEFEHVFIDEIPLMPDFIDSSALSCCQNAGYFRHLQSLYEEGELAGAINRIIEEK